MIKPRSRLQAFILLFVYLIVAFFLVGVASRFLGSSINFYNFGVWSFGWSDVPGVLPGAIAYAVPVGVGICVLSYMKGGRGR